MRVRVLQDCKGFVGGRMRYGGEEFDLVPIKGAKRTLTAKEQFSSDWMEEIKQLGPKPKNSAPAIDLAEEISD